MLTLVRALMNLMKDRHGTFYARVKVPVRLQAAVAGVRGSKRPTQVFLKKSLGTKDLKVANIRGKLVLADFDRTISEAAALVKPSHVAMRESLNATEIARMAEYVFAKQLAFDERFRFGGRDELKRLEVEVRRQQVEGAELEPWAFPYDTLPPHGLSAAQLQYRRELDDDSLHMMRDALAMGDIGVEEHVADALSAFGINLASSSSSDPTLGTAILNAYVRALKAIEQRNAGEPVETPKVAVGTDAGLGVPRHRTTTMTPPKPVLPTDLCRYRTVAREAASGAPESPSDSLVRVGPQGSSPLYGLSWGLLESPKGTSGHAVRRTCVMSVRPPTADIRRRFLDVREVPDSEVPDFCDAIALHLRKSPRSRRYLSSTQGQIQRQNQLESGQLPKSPPEVKSIDCTETASNFTQTVVIRL